MNSQACLAALSLAAPLSAPLHAQEVLLEPVKDNTLYQQFQGSLSNGKGSTFFVGRNNDGRRRRGLLAFDFSSIPPGSTITAVSLVLECTAAPQIVVPVDHSLHRAIADWGEGNSLAGGPGGVGAPSQDDDATWIHTFFPGSLWSNPGGDFDPAPSATTTVVDEGTYTFAGSGLVSDVQAWLDQTQDNYGWLMKDDLEPDQSARRYASREATDPTIRPQLLVEFDAPAIGQIYCSPATPNSTGLPAGLLASGSPEVALGLVKIQVSNLPPQRTVILVAGRSQAQTPVGQGTLCLGGGLGRLPVQDSGPAGQAVWDLDLSALPAPAGRTAVLAGETWTFQAWYEDSNPGPTSNFSDAVQLDFL